jgi:hypothetical protein
MSGISGEFCTRDRLRLSDLKGSKGRVGVMELARREELGDSIGVWKVSVTILGRGYFFFRFPLRLRDLG